MLGPIQSVGAFDTSRPITPAQLRPADDHAAPTPLADNATGPQNSGLAGDILALLEMHQALDDLTRAQENPQTQQMLQLLIGLLILMAILEGLNNQQSSTQAGEQAGQLMMTLTSTSVSFEQTETVLYVGGADAGSNYQPAPGESQGRYLDAVA